MEYKAELQEPFTWTESRSNDVNPDYIRSTSPETLESVSYAVSVSNDENIINGRWFNVRLDYSGRYLESSEGYRSERDALDHRLESDLDTVFVKC